MIPLTYSSTISVLAFSTMSALADRIKIARNAVGMDINLSIQYILNCGSGTAGSCYGGYHTGAYQFIKDNGFIPYDTCQPYIACSSDSTQGFCGQVDTSCNAVNTCVTCSGFDEECVALNYFPNATIAEVRERHSGIKINLSKFHDVANLLLLFSMGPYREQVPKR